MEGVYLVLIGLSAFGFVPLLIILYKRKLVTKILAEGHVAKARVYHVYKPARSAADVVYYQFYNAAGTLTPGRLTTKAGSYQINDVLDVYYLPHNPRRNTVPGAWQSKGFLIFGVVIAAFVLFAVYMLFQDVKAGRM